MQYPLEWLPNLESNSHTSWKLWGGFGIGVSTRFSIKCIIGEEKKFKPLMPPLTLHCQQLHLFENKFYPAWTDHVWRESDYNDGVKDHADDTIPGFCRSYLLKFCPYALHSHGHPNVNNPVPGHFLSNTNSPVSHTCDLVRLLCLS